MGQCEWAWVRLRYLPYIPTVCIVDNLSVGTACESIRPGRQLTLIPPSLRPVLMYDSHCARQPSGQRYCPQH